MKSQVKSVKNFRDLCYLSDDLIKIKNGLLIRSGHLNKINKRDINYLKNELKLSLIIDVRSFQEIKEKPDIKIDGIEYINLPVFSLETYGITREHDSIKNAIIKNDKNDLKNSIPPLAKIYGDIIKNEDSLNNLRIVINTIMNNIILGRGVLYHCSAGKDRTGIITFILLKMLGLSDDLIINDYLKTNIYAKKEKRKVYIGLLLIKRSKSLAKMISEMMLAKEEYINGFIESVNEVYNDFNNFINTGLKISDEQINDFKNKILF